MNVFSKIAGWFRKLFAGTRQLFFVVWTASRKEISDALNDPELQQLALVAVRNAAYRGLTGDAAWTDALAQFKVAVEGRGHEVGRAILEAILQNVYIVFKFNGGLEGDLLK